MDCCYLVLFVRVLRRSKGRSRVADVLWYCRHPFCIAVMCHDVGKFFDTQASMNCDSCP